LRFPETLFLANLNHFLNLFSLNDFKDINPTYLGFHLLPGTNLPGHAPLGHTLQRGLLHLLPLPLTVTGGLFLNYFQVASFPMGSLGRSNISPTFPSPDFSGA
jgi:hypothetical protein